MRGEAVPAGAIVSGSPFPPEVVKAIQRDEGRDPSPENQAALAVLDLVGGRPEEAVRLLRKAHALQPADPRFLNDLAAAALAVNEVTGDPWAALEAVDVAKQADQMEPSPSARFNMALALERLGSRVRTIAAWERYLELDSSSSWAEEAEQRLDRLKGQVRPQLTATPAADITGFPDNPWARRQLGERVLLTRWAEQSLAHQPAAADAALAQAEVLATTLTPEGGRLLTGSIATIREAEQSGDRVRLDLLLRGHQAFGRAFLRLREEHAVEGRALIAAAIGDLQAAKTPFELRARVLQAWLATEPDWDELRRISQEAEAGGFPSILAEAHRIAAFRMTLEGRMEASLEVYQDSQRRFAALGEKEAARVISAMRTELLTDLRRAPESSAELAAALEAGSWVADPWSRYSIYFVAANTASGRFSRAAVELLLEAADACGDLPERPLCAVDSWLWAAAMTPDADVAEDALRQAEDRLPKIPPSEGKTRTEIDLLVSRARLLGAEGRADGDREKAADLYRRAAARYDARRLAVSSADARAGRARLLKALGRPKDAIAEYRAALRTFRLWDQSDRFRPDRAEKSSPTVLRDVYEGLIGAELGAAGNAVSPAAFLLSEEMRDRLAPRRSTEIRLSPESDLPRFVAAVPSGTAIIEYAFFGDRAAAWILADGRLDQVKLILPADLGERIHSLASERHLATWKRASGALFADLLTPVLARLPAGTERLVLIPDMQLNSLPFRALWNPGTGRYLDEDFTLALAPSVRQLLGMGEDRRPVASERGLRLLSLGFRKFLPDLDLAELPLAEEEAASVLGMYGSRANPCSSEDWEGFRRCAPRADVIHLATHAAANSDVDQSWLAFPDETVGIERIWRELPALPRSPLVVLSACQSVAAAKGGEGLGGLARPFLASGARAVVGTLWKLDDVEAAVLFSDFHREYRDSGDAARALRETRRALQDWARKPWVWGGVEVLSASMEALQAESR